MHGRGKKPIKQKNNLKKTKLITLEKRKQKKNNANSITKDRTIRDILTLYETKEEKKKKEIREKKINYIW